VDANGALQLQVFFRHGGGFMYSTALALIGLRENRSASRRAHLFLFYAVLVVLEFLSLSILIYMSWLQVVPKIHDFVSSHIARRGDSLWVRSSL
jgi:hypothetical protein